MELSVTPKLNIIYSEETRVSQLTNRLIDQNVVEEKVDNVGFHCSLCNVKLENLYSTIQHYFSRSHLANTGKNVLPSWRDLRKRKLNQTDSNEQEQHANGVTQRGSVNNSFNNNSSSRFSQSYRNQTQPQNTSLYQQKGQNFHPYNDKGENYNNYYQKEHNSNNTNRQQWQNFSSYNKKGQSSNVYPKNQAFQFNNQDQFNSQPRPNKVRRSDANQVYPFSCDICGAKFNSSASASEHYNGKRHKEAMMMANVTETKESNFSNPSSVSKTESMEMYHCDICNNTFNSQTSADQHYKGKKHKQAVADRALNNGTALSKVPVIGTQTNAKGNVIAKYHCTFCDIALNSDEQMAQHCNGIRHKLNSGEIKEPPSWWCEQQEGFRSSREKRTSGTGLSHPFECSVCCICLNSEDQLADHLKSKRHLENERRRNESKLMEGNSTEKMDLVYRKGSMRERMAQGGSNYIPTGRGANARGGRQGKKFSNPMPSWSQGYQGYRGSSTGYNNKDQYNLPGGQYNRTKMDETSPNFEPMAYYRFDWDNR